MPSFNKHNSKSGDLLVASRKQSVMNLSGNESKKELKKFFDIPNPKTQTREEIKICDLQVQVSSLKKENMELRMLINQLLEMGIDLSGNN